MDNSQHTTQDPTQRAGYAFVTFSTFAAGLATVIGKWNLEAISPLLMNCLIFSIASAILGLTYVPMHGVRRTFTLTKQGWLWLGLFTASSWLAIWAFWAGVQRMDPSLAAFLNRSEVPIAILLGILFLKERFTRGETLGAVLSIAGIVVMRLTLRVEYTEGFWLVLIGSFFFGITEFLSKVAVSHVEPTVLAFIRNLFMAAAFWIVFLGSSREFGGLAEVWPGVLALGIVGPILSRLMYLMALKRMELSKVAVISQGQPVFVILIALLAFGQLPTFREFIGGICLTAGCLIMIVARPRHRRRPADLLRPD